MKVLVGCTVVSFLLAGCDSVRNTLGIDHYQPDEMQSGVNPPLTQPPHFKLRPPRPGAPSPSEKDAAEETREALVASVPSKETVVSFKKSE